MPWYVSIVIYAVIGALAGAIGYIVSSVFKKGRNVVEISMIAIGLIIAKLYIIPEVNFLYFEKSLRNIPLYNTISEVEPDAYNSIREELKNMLHEGKSYDQAGSTIRSVIVNLINKYRLNASDEAIIKSTTISVEELKRLEANSADLCLKFLYPAKYGSVNLRGYISEEMQMRDLDAMKDIIISGAKNPQPVPDPKIAEQLLGKIAPNLYNKYGDKLAIMDDPSKFDTNKNELCSMTISLYEEALNLPPKESSMLIRYLYSENM